jgi:hypothetical protein
MQFFGVGRLSTVQSVAYTGTAGTISNPVGAQTYKVRVLCTTDAHVVIGDSPTATTSDTYVTGLVAEYFTITPGQKVSAIRENSSGTLYVTEIT